MNKILRGWETYLWPHRWYWKSWDSNLLSPAFLPRLSLGLMVHHFLQWSRHAHRGGVGTTVSNTALPNLSDAEGVASACQLSDFIFEEMERPFQGRDVRI